MSIPTPARRLPIRSALATCCAPLVATPDVRLDKHRRRTLALQQRPDLGQGETGTLQHADFIDSCKRRRTIQAIAGMRTRIGTQQAARFVLAQGLGRYAAARSELADPEILRGGAAGVDIVAKIAACPWGKVNRREGGSARPLASGFPRLDWICARPDARTIRASGADTIKGAACSNSWPRLHSAHW